MVALNWQSCDKGMMLNEAMFAGTGGWILKPPAYRGGDGPDHEQMDDDDDDNNEVRGSQGKGKRGHSLDLRLEIFAAQDLPLPSDNEKAEHFRPCVKCTLYIESSAQDPTKTCPSEKKSSTAHDDNNKGNLVKGHKQKLKTKVQRGVEPDFRGEQLIFTTVHDVIDQLSFLR